MVQAHLDIKRIHNIKDILFRIQQGESKQNVQEDFDQHVHPLTTMDVLLILQELKNSNQGIAMEVIKQFLDIYHDLYGYSVHELEVPDSQHPGHPFEVFKKENQVFESVLGQINNQMKAIELDPTHPTVQLLDDMKQLGEFYSHYNRKEKLFFPILERRRIYSLSRTMWAEDDRIRTLYKGTTRLMEKMPDIDFQYVKQAYSDLEQACKNMMVEEEYFLLPIAQSLFTEADWIAIAKESGAFGYAVKEPKIDWIPDDADTETETETVTANTEHFRLGGGYLSLKEANHILNNLPLEITFVDKNGIFKYFNEVVESSEMMFIRTPTSIGRNVAMCHPPKSMRKVMQLIQDLKAKKRTSESMWFKKKEEFIHVTYKGVFDDDGEYLGILEYVQDIQPFLDLPREVKRELSER